MLVLIPGRWCGRFFSPVSRSASCTALQSAQSAIGTCPESELPNFMSDVSAVSGGTTTSGGGTALLSGEAMGRFDENGVYIPRAITEDDLAGSSLEDAMVGTIVEFEDGDLVEGTVVKIDRDEVLLDIGFKSEGVIPVRELSIRNDVDPSEIVSLGDKVEALVLQKEDKEGRLILSKKRAQYERAWGTIEKLKENDEVVTGPVIEVVKGGLIVDIGLRGFLPASLVELRRVRELQPYVGRTIEAKIIELDRNRNNVVLSRRAWLEETQKEQRGEFLTNLKPGERRRGVVSSVVNFGAFVDLGGMDGLVHVSELSWKHVDHPSSVVSVGDEIEVEVLDVDLSKERISLSLKATQNDPWQEFANSHQVGELVYGRITKLVPFGSFVQVGDGIEGLVHISEMAVHHVDLPEQVVTPGEELWVKIIDIDLQRRRISLSIKQAAEGGEVSEEYREAFGEHAYDAEGNYIGPFEFAEAEFTPETEAQAAWAEYVAEHGPGEGGEGEAPVAPAGAVEAAPVEAAPVEAGEAAPVEAAPVEAGEVVTETEAGPLSAEAVPEAAAPAPAPAAPEAAAPQAAPVAPTAAPAAAPAATQVAPVPPAQVETETEAGPLDTATGNQ
ncbi:MAG TPA: 30S ribosomal protein S1 [Acidimicrobiales bacterium]|nr:30S ribosomal protein S1 [Acidimicrobiales bacterium]